MNYCYMWFDEESGNALDYFNSLIEALTVLGEYETSELETTYILWYDEDGIIGSQNTNEFLARKPLLEPIE